MTAEEEYAYITYILATFQTTLFGFANKCLWKFYYRGIVREFQKS